MNLFPFSALCFSPSRGGISTWPSSGTAPIIWTSTKTRKSPKSPKEPFSWTPAWVWFRYVLILWRSCPWLPGILSARRDVLLGAVEVQEVCSPVAIQTLFVRKTQMWHDKHFFSIVPKSNEQPFLGEAGFPLKAELCCSADSPWWNKVNAGASLRRTFHQPRNQCHMQTSEKEARTHRVHYHLSSPSVERIRFYCRGSQLAFITHSSVMEGWMLFQSLLIPALWKQKQLSAVNVRGEVSAYGAWRRWGFLGVWVASVSSWVQFSNTHLHRLDSSHWTPLWRKTSLFSWMKSC